MFLPLRHRDYRVFWIGLLLSSIGSQFTTVAIAWQIYELTNSPLQLGLMGLARGVPQVIMLLFGGLLADAADRRKVILCTQSILFIISGLLGLSTFTGRTTPLTLYTATMALAVFNSLEAPARHSIVANLVPRQELAQAMAMYNSQRHVATIAGPAIAGVVLALSGPAICYAIDAVSWLIMFAAVAMIRAPLPQGGGRGAVSISSLRAGFSFVLQHAVIFPLLLMDFGANLFGTVRSLLPIFAKDILQVGPQGLGILYAASACGALAGGFFLSFAGAINNIGRWILAGVTIYGAALLFFGASDLLWCSVLLLAISGVGDTISAIMRSTINQLETPEDLRGRMSSINSLFTNCGPQLGQFQAGVLAAIVGPEVAVVSGGFVILFIVALLIIKFPHVRDFKIRSANRL